jgi:hypothetical protein
MMRCNRDYLENFAMNIRPVLMIVFAFVALLQVAAKPSHEIKAVKELPKDLPKEVATIMDPNGFAIAGPDATLGTVWLAKELALKPGFKPNFSVKYPFTNGQLVGVLQVEKDASMTDFRGQELKAGVYTLRYGQQPQDGNHIGTSELSDFLLALPAAKDTKPGTLTDGDQLIEGSASAAGSTHPAIFSLLPPEKAGEAKLTHNEDREYWILEATANGKDKEQPVKVPLKIVVVDISEA